MLVGQFEIAIVFNFAFNQLMFDLPFACMMFDEMIIHEMFTFLHVLQFFFFCVCSCQKVTFSLLTNATKT